MKLNYTILGLLSFFIFSEVFCQPNLNSPMGTNVPGINDYGSNLPFQDFFKSSRGWTSQIYSNTTWGSGPTPLDVDENGWLRSLENADHYVTSVVCGDLPDRPEGTYHLYYDGEGTFRFWGGWSFVSEPEPGHIILNVTSGAGTIFFDIQETDPNSTGDYIRNIKIVPEQYLSTYETELWNPDYLKIMENFKFIRPLWMQQVWGSPLTSWSERKTPDTYTQTGVEGCCIEYVVDMANKLQTDLWINIPHKVDDDYVTNLASYILDSLDTNLDIYVEYGNEVWNGISDDATYAGEMAVSLGYCAADRPWEGRPLFYADRSVECFNIFESVFGSTDRLIRVLAWQTGSTSFIRSMLKFEVEPGDSAYQFCDAVATAPYFGHALGSSSIMDEVKTYSVEQMIDICEHMITEKSLDMRNVSNLVKSYTNDKGNVLKLIAYEGGQHIVGDYVSREDDDLNELFYATNRSSEMRNVYMDYHNLWKDAGGDEFCAFELIGEYSMYGSWGLLENYQNIEAAPKYGGIMSFIEQNSPPWWTLPEPTPPPVGDLFIDFDASALPGGISQNRSFVTEDTVSERMNFDMTTNIFDCGGDAMGEFSGGFYFNWNNTTDVLSKSISLSSSGFRSYVDQFEGNPTNMNGIILWKKSQFQNGYDLSSNVTLGKLEINVSTQPSGDVRFVVKNGTKYYVSNYILSSGLNELTEFDNSAFVTKRWMEFTPGATDFDMPHWRLNPVCNTEAVVFNDIQEVGLLFTSSKSEYGHTFVFDQFRAYTRSDEELAVTIDPALGQNNPATTIPINFTVQFNQPVTDFDQNDVTISGSASPTTVVVTETRDMDGTTYNVAVSGMSLTGFVAAEIAAGVATSGGHPNFASTSRNNYVQYNISDPPTVTIEQATDQDDPDLSLGDVRFIATFSEAVTGFSDASDVSLSGTAGPTTATINEITPNDGTTFEILVSGMTSDGTVIAEIPVSAAFNGLGAANVASSSIDNTVFWYNSNPPTVTVNQAAAQNDPAFASNVFFTAVFNQAVTGFTNTDVIISGSAGATGATVTEIAPFDGTTYSIEVSGMSNDGNIILNIPAGVADNAGNLNLESTSTDNEIEFRLNLPSGGTAINFQATETEGASVNRSFIRSDDFTRYIPFSTEPDSAVFTSENDQALWYGGVYQTSLDNLDTVLTNLFFHGTEKDYFMLMDVGPETSMEENHMFCLWKKDQFMNNLDVVNVGFNNDTIESRIAVHFKSIGANSGFEFHFVIKQNGQYYLSEYEQSGNYGSTGWYELKGFNNLDEAGMRWGEFNPTETDFIIPAVMPTFSPMDFNNIEEVGFIIFSKKDQYGCNIRFDQFVVDAISIIPQYDVTFTINDGTDPIENAAISFNSQTLNTNSSGQVTFVDVNVGMAKPYSITATDFITESGNINVVDQDVSETITMTPVGAGTYTVTFTVDDGTDPIENAQITFNSQTISTNASGLAVFAGVVPASDIAYIITSAGYDTETGTITLVDQDLSETVSMSLTTYTLTVTDGSGSGQYLPGTQVTIIATIGQDEQFNGWTGDTQYLDDASNDTTVVTIPTADVNIAADIESTITTFNITFIVSDGTLPVEGAEVTFNGEIKTTDATGSVIFNDVEPGNSLFYSVNKTGFDNYSSMLNVVDVDMTENIVLYEIVLPDGITDNQINVQIYPVPAKEVLNIVASHHITQISILNISGCRVLETNPKGRRTIINTSALPKGVYILNMRFVNGANTKEKIILQ